MSINDPVPMPGEALVLKCRSKRYDTFQEQSLGFLEMNKKLLEILACPMCKGTLIYLGEAQELVCRLDKIAYPIREGIPVMLSDEGRTLSLAEWEQLPKS